MSITPGPTDGDTDESVAMLMEREPSDSPAPANKYSFGAWTQDRAEGERNMVKKPSRRYQPVVRDEEDEEADISKYIYVDGVIVFKGGLEEMDLTGEAQTMRRGGSGGEREEGVWEMMKGAVGCRMS